MRIISSQTAEGRGSKVETLPGGTNLGEIDDPKILYKQTIKRFTYSVSICPTGADDGQSPT